MGPLVDFAHRLSDEPGSAIASYDQGAHLFARMFTRWMDGNGWSHPVITKLARAAMGGSQGWLHSSQVASLRNANTRNPGPRTFVAIERLNYYLWRYQTSKTLIPTTSSSNDYNHAVPITEGGLPPNVGWFVEVFCGCRIPEDFDLTLVKIPPDQAQLISKRIGRMLRNQMVHQDLDLVEDLGGVLYAHYPTQERASLDRVRALAFGDHPLEASELETELPNLAVLLSALGHTTTEDELLTSLRR